MAEQEQGAAPATGHGGGFWAKFKAHFDKHKNLYAIGLAGVGVAITYLIYKQGQSGSGTTSITNPTGTQTPSIPTPTPSPLGSSSSAPAGDTGGGGGTVSIPNPSGDSGVFTQTGDGSGSGSGNTQTKQQTGTPQDYSGFSAWATKNLAAVPFMGGTTPGFSGVPALTPQIRTLTPISADSAQPIANISTLRPVPFGSQQAAPTVRNLGTFQPSRNTDMTAALTTKFGGH